MLSLDRPTIALLALSALACGDSSAPLTVDTTPPSVVVTLSSDNITSASNLGISAAAEDETGVTKVEFYERAPDSDAVAKISEDTSEPYHFERAILSATENGSYEFTTKAYDAAGNVGISDIVTLTVNIAAVPPVFTISATHDHITTPGRITFSAQPAEGLSRMEVYEHGIKVGESEGSGSPPSVTIEVGRTDNGNRSYVARGYGEGGEIGLSNSLPIQVDIRWDVFRGMEEMGRDELVYLASDAEGAAYVAATKRTESNSVINLDAVLSKYDADGNRIWTRTFGGADWELVYGLGVDPAGRPYLSGYVSYREEESRSADCFLSLYDQAGNLLWTRTVDKPEFVGVCASATDISGSFYLAGAVEEGSSAGGRTDVIVTKLTPDGNRLWTQEFGSEPGVFGDDITTSIAVDPLGGVYVGGYTSGSMDGTGNQGGRDLFVTKLDADGNRLWSRQYGTDYHDFANSLAADPHGGVYVAGGRDHPDIRFGAYGDALLIRYGSDGTLLWADQLDGGYFDDAWGVVADQDAVHLVGRTSVGTSGQFTEATQGFSDAFLASFTGAGGLLSVSLLGGPGQDGATGVAPGRNGDIYLVLGSQGGLAGIPDAGPVLARYQAAGP